MFVVQASYLRNTCIAIYIAIILHHQQNHTVPTINLYLVSGKEGTSSSSKSSRYDYNEDWGEKYDGVAELSLHVLDVLHMRVCTVSDIDSTKWTVGQPCFLRRSTTEDDDSSNNMDVLVYTAWNTRPRKLGMIYCYQVTTTGMC